MCDPIPMLIRQSSIGNASCSVQQLLRESCLIGSNNDNDTSCNILASELTKLSTIGFKLIPLLSKHIPTINWGQLYDDLEYWKPESLLANHSKFKNVAIAMGPTHIKDKDGLNLNLNCLDVDSEYVSRLLSILL